MGKTHQWGEKHHESTALDDLQLALRSYLQKFVSNSNEKWRVRLSPSGVKNQELDDNEGERSDEVPLL